MPKVKIIRDTFEQIAELGGSTVKKGAEQTAKTFSPLSIFENLISTDSETPKKNTDKKPEGHTPIDIKDLTKTYEAQDKQKEHALRNKLFRLVKGGDDQELEKKKAEEQQKTVEEQREEQEKIEKEKRIRESQAGDVPQGKKRRSIFSPRVKAQREHAEYKPASGKS